MPPMMATAVLLHAALVWIVLSILVAGAHSSDIRTSGTRFLDNFNRTVVLRGFNVAGNSKVPDFRPIKDPAAQLLPLKRLGANVIRLLFTWEAYEPVRGQYDSTYLDYVVKIVNTTAEMGIYTIVDIHQDAFSRYSLGGCGEGFPQWAVPNTTAMAVPNNSEAQCAGWGLALPQDTTVPSQFAAFYANVGGVRDSFLDLVEHLATVFSSFPSVIGIDILNEPIAHEAEIGKLYADAALRIQGSSSSNGGDNSTGGSSLLVFMCPQYLVTSGLVATKLPAPTFPNGVYAPHFYNLFNIYGGYDFGAFTSKTLGSHTDKALEWNVPLFLGEFGVSQKSLPESFINDMYTYLDSRFLSGTQWSFTPGWNPINKDGWNGEDFSVIVSGGQIRSFPFRPSVRRVAGEPLMDFIINKWVYYFRWRQDPSIRQPTVLYVPHEYFGGPGRKLHLSSSKSLVCAFVDDVTLECSGSSGATEEAVFVMVTAKPFK